jgi:nucleoside phosphorylase
LAKRPKISDLQSGEKTAHRKDEYDVAWVCVLHIEMGAARAMLDETHDPLPSMEDDTNSYVLGRIQAHNVVLACLPNAEYGTNNAAHVASNLKRTFPSIKYWLMVGIGGADPSRQDIRLGDVVVGTRVMQYDYGKIAKGEFKTTAIPRLPDHSLGTAISNLRSKHELEPTQIPSILQDKLGKHQHFLHPNLPDRLFRKTYEHGGEASSCEDCDSSKIMPRRIRMSNIPQIHYGAIASGNQVMKDAWIRDKVGSELDVICFEMEAAGIMGVLPCLPIRGICDYADSHKCKGWQRYAAATASAYTRELLEVLPSSNVCTLASSHSDTGKLNSP